ncbi:hypothetical protein ACIGHB_32750 [Streptomyces sp. NPDC085460]|uniref:hypothetical protein n=1 Tax=Streptomyces sp. NPDC085460 TaxID=3365723 RepID=UPI0037CE9036
MKPLERLGVTGDFPAAATCRGLTMHVRPGEIVGLLGADGAGKITPFRHTRRRRPASIGVARSLIGSRRPA